MPQSEASSAWEVLSKDDPHSSPSPVAFPTSPTSPTFPTASGSAAIKGPTETIAERLAKVSLGKSGQPLPQGHQARNVSGGSVDSGSSAWGTLASKSILSGSKAKKDKEDRRALKEEKKEKGSISGTKEKSDRTRKERTNREDKALEKQRDTRPKAEVVEKVQPAQPESTTASSSIVHVAVPSSSASAQPIINSSADHNKKPRRSRKGKNARADAGDIVTPEPGLSHNASVASPSSAPTALELWSEVQSQPALSSAAGISVADMSVAEMSSQHRKGKRHRSQKPARSAERGRDDEAGSRAAGMLDVGQDLTVTEMVMEAKARARRGGAPDQESSRGGAEEDEEIRREKRRTAQREKRNRAAARKQAERQAATGDYDHGDRVAPGSTGGQGRSNLRSGNEDNFRADSAAPAQSFRLVRGTSDTSRGTSGTATDSGVLLSDGSMNRNETRGIKQTTASSSRATGGGGSSSAMYTHTKSSADPLYSGYLVVEPPSAGSSRTFGTISDSNESVAPHHSISRRGSFDHSAGRERDAPTTTVIIGLERLDLNARRDPSVGPAGKQAGQVKSIQQPKHKGYTPVPPPRPHSISNTLGSASTRPSAHPHERYAPDDTDDAHSITSYEEAHSSVRAYLDQDLEFLADPKNQLVFWQGLCVEVSKAWSKMATAVRTDQVSLSFQLGLALPTNMTVGMQHGSSSRIYSETSEEEHVICSTTSKRRRACSTTSSTSSARTTTTASDRTAQAGDLSRSSTPRPVLPPVPRSKTACLRLLKAGAHINLSDWFEVRPEVNQRLADLRRRRGAGAVLGEEEMEYVYEPLRRLMFPSPSAMIRSVFALDPCFPMVES
jgi:hypothetical protein